MYCQQNTFRLVLFCGSFVYTINNSDPNSEFCCTSTSTPSQPDSCPLKLTNWFLSVKSDFNNFKSFQLFQYILFYPTKSLYPCSQRPCSDLIKLTAQTTFSWSNEYNVLSTNSNRANVVECPSLYLNWKEFKILKFVKKLYIQLYMAISMILLMYDKSKICP